VYFAALVHGLEASVIRRIGARLVLSPRMTQELIDGLNAAERGCDRLSQPGHIRPSQVVAALRTLPLEMLPLLLALCPGGEVHRHVRRYLAAWRHIRPDLTGDDLKRLGVPQGPHIGQLLSRLLAARLDGEATSRDAEEALVHSALVQMQAS
jgi:tRNA nucleotidyltransferase (CCA-adding enzyme)